MEAQSKRVIANGEGYNRFFPADLEDTLTELKKLIPEHYAQVKDLAKELTRDNPNLYETCRRIWQFVYRHIQYKLDEPDTEQLRTPARIWADRVHGVDCDDYTIFISSLLICLQIPHAWRLAEYKNKGYYQHIYVVVPQSNGKKIAMDCVMDEFNSEEYYTKIKDIQIKIEKNMQLQILSGFGNTPAKVELKHLVLDKWQTQNGDIYLQKLDDKENATYVKIDAGENIVNGANARTLIESDIIQVDEFSSGTDKKDETTAPKTFWGKTVDFAKENPFATGVIVLTTFTAGAWLISMINASPTPAPAPKPASQEPISGFGNKKTKLK
jgi:hypothetical protein